MIEQFIEAMQNRVNRSTPTAQSNVAGGDAKQPFALGVVTKVDSSNAQTIYEVAQINAAGNVVRHFAQVVSWQETSMTEGSKCLLLWPNGPDEIPVAFTGGGASVSASASVALVINREPLYTA